MPHVYSQTSSGLTVAYQAADEAAIGRALREYDDGLRLVPQDSDAYGRIIYKVFRWNGSDRPAQFVLAFVDERGEPLPLSSRLLDMVRLQDRNTRNGAPDENTLNARARLERDRDVERMQEALKDDMMTVSGRGHAGMLPRGQSLRRARDKQRAKGRKI